MQRFNPRWVISKTVERVDMRPFPDGRGGTAHAPIVRFTDGSALTFLTEETEEDGYGTDFRYWPPKARAPRR
jgi:hypothetical protein